MSTAPQPLRAVTIVPRALSADEISGATLASAAHGAICSFVGVVRDTARGKAVLGLHYQCYQPMAEQVLATLIAEAAAAHDTALAATIIHGHGPMRLGEAVVAIHVASAHRAAAFAACRQLIERLKADVPIWKHERYADGSNLWIHGS